MAKIITISAEMQSSPTTSLITQEGWQSFLTMCSPHVYGFTFHTQENGKISVLIYLQRAYYEHFYESYLVHLRLVAERLCPPIYSLEITVRPAIENELLDSIVINENMLLND